MSTTDKNPVMLLNELRPGLNYEVGESGETPVTKRFIMTVQVEEQTFEGSGKFINSDSFYTKITFQLYLGIVRLKKKKFISVLHVCTL